MPPSLVLAGTLAALHDALDIDPKSSGAVHERVSADPHWRVQVRPPVATVWMPLGLACRCFDFPAA